MKHILIAMIRAYQRLSAPLYVAPGIFLNFSGCRSWPTCSEYSIRAIEQGGALRGGMRSIVRIIRCNPFSANPKTP